MALSETSKDTLFKKCTQLIVARDEKRLAPWLVHDLTRAMIDCVTIQASSKSTTLSIELDKIDLARQTLAAHPDTKYRLCTNLLQDYKFQLVRRLPFAN